MARTYELVERPSLERPVLVVALEGWIDAGLAAEIARDLVLDQLETTVVATFDDDLLLDFRARRPTMHLADGINTGLTWASTELLAATTDDGQDLLLLVGAEPDHAWRSFAGDVRELVVDLGCRLHVGLGAYPAGAPHTRPVQLSATASSDDLAATVGFLRGTIDVPAGVEAVIERELATAGVPAAGIWAQVPHYAAAMRYPAAAAALVEGLNHAAGTDFTTTPLADEIAATRTRIDRLLAGNPEHLAMVRQLENLVDSQVDQAENLPSGDDLAAELQRFLREQGGEQ